MLDKERFCCNECAYWDEEDGCANVMSCIAHGVTGHRCQPCSEWASAETGETMLEAIRNDRLRRLGVSDWKAPC